ncbi:MAG TPA: hypothetical protein PKC29_03700 [Thermodesulfobacteriota bacterium]|nr:hypothetical protein [Thermodesulfobacteriota bacterium]
MRDSLSNFFSYLFMVTVSIAAVTIFAALVILFRSLVMETGAVEEEAGFMFLYVFIGCCILSPIFLYLSNRLEKYKRPMDGL